MYSSFDDYDLRSTSDESEHKTYEDSDENEDKIDSDIETALYSQIHHQENPFYESTVEESENLQAKDDSNDQNNDNDKSLDSALNKDNATPFVITISDESDVYNVDDTSSNDIQFICETKSKINNDGTKNHRNKWWENFVSTTYNDDDDENKVLIKDEKNSDDDDNHAKHKILTELKSSFDLKATSVALPHKNKRTKKSSTLQAKGTATKRSSKRKLSDSSEDNAFKSQQRRTEGKDVLINVKPSVVTVDLAKDDELWQLCSKDVYKNKQESRYYNKNKGIICNNCSERGHISRDCKMPRKRPVCYLCGKVGHQGRDCLNPACSMCLSVGHSRQHCQWTDINIEKCPLCNMMDHLIEDCPDKWRRYHMMMAPGPIIYGNSSRNCRVYCYNCAREGHFGHECDRERMDEDTYPTSPFISYYCEPVTPFSADYTTVYKNGKLKKRLMKLARKKQVAINKSNKQFQKKSRYLHCRAEKMLKLSLSPSSVTNKKPRKKKNFFKNTSRDKIDSSLASSSQMSNVVCGPPKKKRKRKGKSLLQQTESHQKSKVNKSKKKKKKLQNTNIKTELIQGDNIKASNCENLQSSSIAANIFRSLVPPDLCFSMKCMNFFSGKRL